METDVRRGLRCIVWRCAGVPVRLAQEFGRGGAGERWLAGRGNALGPKVSRDYTVA